MATQRPTLFDRKSPFRIFFFSVVCTMLALGGIGFTMGVQPLAVAVILLIVELTFSFENAIINAKVVSRLSRFWQTMFLTVGIAIAIIGMRIVFPVCIVMATSGLGWSEVVDLAFNHPDQYAQALEAAHPEIAAFGGAFLLMLALHFFIGDQRETLWLKRIEGHMQRYATFWLPFVVATVVIVVFAYVPGNHHTTETLVAGGFGIILYTVMHAMIRLFETIKQKKDAERGVSKVALQTGMAAFLSFMYLEILDASFSFDSVIGAFAVTNNVILIALGLGVGAIWVRSLTVFMVRNGTLSTYKYLEHGAHYTVFVLAAVLLLGLLWNIPELFAGIVGIGLIAVAAITSREATD